VNAMGISRKQALTRITGISSQIDAHLAKLDEEPRACAAVHWNAEIERWISQVKVLARSAGSRSEIETHT